MIPEINNMLYCEMYKLTVSESITCNPCVDRCDTDFLWHHSVAFSAADIDLSFSLELEKCTLVSFAVHFDIKKFIKLTYTYNVYTIVNYLGDTVYTSARDDKERKSSVNISNVHSRISQIFWWCVYTPKKSEPIS